MTAIQEEAGYGKAICIKYITAVPYESSLFSPVRAFLLPLIGLRACFPIVLYTPVP